jgi:hypothetical protein
MSAASAALAALEGLDISAAIRHLEAHASVQDVALEERPPSRLADIVAWEQKHQPWRLPADHRAFLMISDGLLLRWRVRCGEELLPLGAMHLNSLAELQPVPSSALVDHFGGPRAEFLAAGQQPLRAFELDSACSHGRVCLVFCEEQDPMKAQARLPSCCAPGPLPPHHGRPDARARTGVVPGPGVHLVLHRQLVHRLLPVCRRQPHPRAQHRTARHTRHRPAAAA